MDEGNQTAALEGYLFGEADRLLARIQKALLANGMGGMDLTQNISEWREGYVQLRKRWGQGDQ